MCVRPRAHVLGLPPIDAESKRFAGGGQVPRQGVYVGDSGGSEAERVHGEDSRNGDHLDWLEREN